MPQIGASASAFLSQKSIKGAAKVQPNEKNMNNSVKNQNNITNINNQEGNFGFRNNIIQKGVPNMLIPRSSSVTVTPSVTCSKDVSGQYRKNNSFNYANNTFSSLFTSVLQLANDEGVDETCSNMQRQWFSFLAKYVEFNSIFSFEEPATLSGIARYPEALVQRQRQKKKKNEDLFWLGLIQ
ncbi:hypothetical protein TNCV_106541 [Trichonephila clavipes]|nr:hypothetical protein TNCV_106541 [Trichonephila clavipes]